MINKITSKLSNRSDDPYYDVDGEIHYSKYQALCKAQSLCVTPDPNEVWGHIKFVVPYEHKGPEPSQSLRELYMERARHIRQNNEYVRIWGSGGADSTHVILAFKEAGVVPDEIATYIQYPGIIDLSQNIEVNNGLREVVRQARQWWPKVKMKTYDILPEHYNWYVENALEHWLSYTELIPQALNWQMVYEIYPELIENDQTLKTANIYSGPNLSMGRDATGWYYMFIDKPFNEQLNAPFQTFFFSDSDTDKMSLKMLYTMKKSLDPSNRAQYDQHDLMVKDDTLLEYFSIGTKMFAQKQRKGRNDSGGILCSDAKSLLRFGNAISSTMGQKTVIKLLAKYYELHQRFPHWFNNGHVVHDYIGLCSKKVYFEKYQ